LFVQDRKACEEELSVVDGEKQAVHSNGLGKRSSFTVVDRMSNSAVRKKTSRRRKRSYGRKKKKKQARPLVRSATAFLAQKPRHL
jgi:hypothetical protein